MRPDAAGPVYEICWPGPPARSRPSSRRRYAAESSLATSRSAWLLLPRGASRRVQLALDLLFEVIAELQASERCASRRSPEQTLKTMAG